MARRSLKPQLNQIRSWVRQGRTDAWIAHQLEVSVRDLAAFKREHDLAPPDEADGEGAAHPEVEVDLRAEDDALVAAALDAEPEDVETEDEEDAPREEEDEAAGVAAGGDEEREEGRPRRRRGRRGGRARRGRARRRPGEPFEGTFDHGEEGYGLWLDPAVQDDPVYAEHWAGHRPVTVVIEPDQIVLRRAGEGANGDGPDGAPDGSSDDASATDADPADSAGSGADE